MYMDCLLLPSCPNLPPPQKNITTTSNPQGKLGQLVQLIHSMCFLTGGLASIMAAFRPQQGFNSSLVHTASTAADLAAGKQLTQQQQQPAGGGGAAGAGEVAAASGAAAAAATAAGVQQDSSEDDVTVDVLIGCVLAAVEELPVWESTEMEQVRVCCVECGSVWVSHGGVDSWG